ncbi:MAG: PQQ-binding-like beta-propeller repeat protein, partial [bacterium]
GTWGYIACADGILYGTLADVGHIVKWSYQWGDMTELFSESKALFAFDVETGTQKWLHLASDSIRHNTIAIGGGKVFLIDRPLADIDRLAKMKRRGIKAVTHPTGVLIALDAASGDVLWTLTENIFGTLLEYSEAHDALLMSHQPSRFQLSSEKTTLMAVYQGSNGDLIWEDADTLRYQNRPMINGNTIYAEPIAADLLTGEKLSFTFSRSYSCGTITGSPNLLLCRSATVGYRDLTVDDSETENFGGCRPGCWINTIAVGGLVLMPDVTHGCTCSYLIRASIALQEDKGAPEPPAGINGFARF